jgi:uncharacterized membrane protein
MTAPEHPPDYESEPLSRSEYIMAIVHLYRGAVLTAAGLLAFGFRSPDNPHWPLLFGTLLITLLLGYEARRFQMFDVWRARLRKIEENFYGPILRRNPVSPQKEWGERVARDLLAPSYKLGYRQAVRARFVRNYWAIYAVLFLSWCVKVSIHPDPATTWDVVRNNVGHGILWWIPLAYIGFLLVSFLLLLFFVKPLPRDMDDFWLAPESGSTSELDA